MPNEPAPLELKLGLRAGSVFYFQSRELTSGQPHFFIVVNLDPLGTQLVLVTIVTSKLDKVRLRNRERPDTVVEISPDEYDEFKVVSAVDCNVILKKSLDELVGLVRRKEVRYHKDLPPVLFARIRTAILASPLVPDDFKQLV